MGNVIGLGVGDNVGWSVGCGVGGNEGNAVGNVVGEGEPVGTGVGLGIILTEGSKVIGNLLLVVGWVILNTVLKQSGMVKYNMINTFDQL